MPLHTQFSTPTGLVLTGGGARAAYQAGAIRAVTELCKEWGISDPFPIITGNSAGAINAAFLAAGIHELDYTTQKLCELWDTVKPNHVFKVDSWSLFKIGLTFVMELSTGNLFGKRKVSRSLLDTSPLFELLTREIDYTQIQKNIDTLKLFGLGVKATNYSTGFSETFLHADQSINTWKRMNRISVKHKINANHIMASTAIPMLFPPMKIGASYFGDGSLRNYTPFSPAIKMGAKRLLVIGVGRSQAAIKVKPRQNMTPSIGKVLSMLLNSVLLDAVDLDLERLSRMNETLDQLGVDRMGHYSKIKVCSIRPTEDVGAIAAQEAMHLPKTMRHLLKGVGTRRESSDLISYLLFESSFTTRLVALGYEDAYAKKEELKSFYLDPVV